MDKQGQIGLMDMDGKSFGEKVGQVVCSRAPLDKELISSDPITEPVILHLKAFGTFGLDGVVGDALRTFIVGEYIGRGLGIAEVGEDIPEACTMLAGEKACCVLGFTDGRHDGRNH